MDEPTRITRPPVHHPLRVLIEDPELTVDDLDAPIDSIELELCPGPGGLEVCPLVAGEPCTHCPADVVVTALPGAWACAVRAAWAETGTPVVDGTGAPSGDPQARLDHHLGSVMARLWPGAEV